MSIIFQSDWTRPDGSLLAIPHLTTKNESFLRHCQVLKRIGISNYAFPLALYNPRLKDVDVHDLEEDTPENQMLRTMVMIEARHNVWYYLRECIRIYSQGGKPVPFKLDRGNCAMTWAFLNGIDYTGMQPRQTGKEQPLYSEVLTPSGPIPMGAVLPGTMVKTPSGLDATVTAIYPQGLRDVYTVTLEDGRSTECGMDHLWPAYTDPNDNHYQVLTLRELVAESRHYWIPVYREDEEDVVLQKLVSVNYVGKRQCQCIEVDHPDHLYITDDNIVTHNTVGALSLTSWVMFSSGEDFLIGMFCKDGDLQRENVKRVKAFKESLPPWWVSETKFRDRNNQDGIYYDALRTEYVTMVAQKDKRQADLKARGSSPSMLHIDELEFCVNIDISYPTMMASTGMARENARINGKPHSNIITTTAGDPSKPECRAAAKILSNAMPFSERLYDVENKEKLHEIIEAASPNKMLLGVWSHIQLGYDNKWLREMITRNSMTREQTMRDYLNRRVSIQETPIIPKETLALITASEREEEFIEIIGGKFTIFWYLKEEVVKSDSFKTRPIVVGCDSSEMIGRDATTLVGIDPRDLSVVFTFRCNEGNLNVVGAMIAQLLMMYPAFIFVPENKSSGTGFIDTVSLLLRREGHNPFKRMFNWIVNNKHEKEFMQYDIRDMNLLDTSAKKFFGIKTDKAKREELYSSTLLTACKTAPNRIRDKTLISELSSLTSRNGRVDHEEGSHDDSVIAFLMAMWFIMNAKHLDVYGIKPGSILSISDRSEETAETIKALKQEKILKRIEELTEKRKYQIDAGLRKLIDSDLLLLEEMLEKTSIPQTITTDELHRDPRKFIDQETSRQARQNISDGDVIQSLRAVFGTNR